MTAIAADYFAIASWVILSIPVLAIAAIVAFAMKRWRVGLLLVGLLIPACAFLLLHY